jgi:hypothetical protein
MNWEGILMGLFDKVVKKSVDFYTGMQDLSPIRASVNKADESGYDFVCSGQSDMMTMGTIWLKDGNYSYTSKSALALTVTGVGSPEKDGIPIEITGVQEITKNAKLVGLQVRYRINGAINVMQVSGSPNQVLTIEDKLGYSG